MTEDMDRLIETIADLTKAIREENDFRKKYLDFMERRFIFEKKMTEEMAAQTTEMTAQTTELTEQTKSLDKSLEDLRDESDIESSNAVDISKLKPLLEEIEGESGGD